MINNHKFIVTLGIQKKLNGITSDRHVHAAGELLEIDWKKNKQKRIYKYTSPKEHTPEVPSVVFKSATLSGDKLYLTTETEIIILNYPKLEVEKVISIPIFNDVHHVLPHKNNLAVAVTGLDMVSIIDYFGGVIKNVNVIGEDVWGRFAKSTDYRRVTSTKPHKSHPNYLFEINGELWVTRFWQKDAVSLNDKSKRINIEVGNPHDGVVNGDFIYFTTINGFIVIANTETYAVEQVIDLNKIDNRGVSLGWCRGIYVDGDFAFVGFTRLRNTKTRQYLSWLKQGFKDANELSPTRIACYDLKNYTLLEERTIDIKEGSSLFSIIGIK